MIGIFVPLCRRRARATSMGGFHSLLSGPLPGLAEHTALPLRRR